ncbi:hypothetical protein VNO77_03895 [Canavalia gladiata]|uniref:Uncharacterized protein n=1 Tax=Canavalia gladiata TaxID=3824 RepID=A0AAN9MXK6_CANGL
MDVVILRLIRSVPGARINQESKLGYVGTGVLVQGSPRGVFTQDAKQNRRDAWACRCLANAIAISPLLDQVMVLAASRSSLLARLQFDQALGSRVAFVAWCMAEIPSAARLELGGDTPFSLNVPGHKPAALQLGCATFQLDFKLAILLLGQNQW